MFDVDRELEQGTFASADLVDYVIRPGDKVALLVFTNRGYNQVNTMIATFSSGSGVQGAATLEHEVRLDSTANLPVIGPYKIAGLTVPEAEEQLATIYNDSGFTDPMVILQVTNWRAVVFIGSRGTTIEFENAHLSLLEALSIAGGIEDQIKSHKVKLIRDIDGQPQVQVLDLSGNDALANSGIIIQPGDIVHAEAVRPFSRAAQQVVTFVGYATTALALYFALKPDP